MKIQQHPRMKDIAIGDEVLCYRNNLYAQVEEVFPAAVCVKLLVFDGRHCRLYISPQLWRAEDVENLSVCRYCGGRDGLTLEASATIPYRICLTCQSVLEASLPDDLLLTSHQRPAQT